MEVTGSWITSAIESNLRPQTTCNSLLLIDREFHISTFGTVANLWLNECQEQDTSEMVVQTI